MAQNNLIRVEVAYATPERQYLVALYVPANTTLETAIERSGVLREFPEIDLQKQKLGIFSKLRLRSDLVKEGDRIEIYRPLIIDPKEARRAKAKSKR